MLASALRARNTALAIKLLVTVSCGVSYQVRQLQKFNAALDAEPRAVATGF